MFRQLTPSLRLLIEQAHVSFSFTKPRKADAPIEFGLAIYDKKMSDYFLLDLSREDALRLRDQINVALVQTPTTPEEARNHAEHQQWLVEKDRGW